MNGEITTSVEGSTPGEFSVIGGRSMMFYQDINNFVQTFIAKEGLYYSIETSYICSGGKFRMYHLSFENIIIIPPDAVEISIARQGVGTKIHAKIASIVQETGATLLVVTKSDDTKPDGALKALGYKVVKVKFPYVYWSMQEKGAFEAHIDDIRKRIGRTVSGE